MIAFPSTPRLASLRLALFSLLAFAPLCFAENPPATPVYQRATAPIDERVEDLLARMNAQEKIAQITSHWIPTPKKGQTVDQALTAEFLEKHFAAGIGSIGPCHLGIDDEIFARNRVKEFLRTKTRLGIPAFFHDELCHGLMKPEATSFPAPIGLACTWNEALIEKLYATAAREARARGTHHALTPVVDVTLDPRWGRTEETLGEDPYLNGRLGTAIIRGLQGGASGDIGSANVMATLKHLAGHGASEGGLNRSPAHIGPIELRETHIAPFATIIRNAKPATVMPSYNEVDGIPSHANRAMLQDLVRGEYGFTGLFVSDYDGVAHLFKEHHVAGTAAEAARLALESGVQMELPIPETFSQLEPLLGKDPALDKLVDDAVRAVLRWKFKLGLFEESALTAAPAHALATSPESRELALQAARESIVLLKNDGGLLPLTVGAHKRIAVIGPNADIARLGGYSGVPLHSVSLLEGLRARVGNQAEILHAEGCKIANKDARDAYTNWKEINDVTLADPVEDQRLIAEAINVASKADLVILALGENEVISRESWAKRKLGDLASLDLVGAQSELARRILATGKPVILYLSNGRPLSLGELGEKIPVILEGWYAGQETGRAAAEILFGDINPSGKLTISFPRSVGHIPAQYRRKPYSAPYTYMFSSHEAQYPFGFGLSYTTFAYSNLRIEKPKITTAENLRVSIDLKNTGTRDGVEIAQLYLRDEVSSVTRPVMELRGFQRVALKAGETRTLTFDLTPDALAFYNRDLKRVIESGAFTVMIGGSSVQTQSARFEVTVGTAQQSLNL
ncbi:MAG: glycoside hydrolase family 3 N-terminal domain-containing protein [Nibricoccus sp.]